MTSRDDILGRLRAAQKPFTDIPPIDERQHMVVINDVSPEALEARFIEEARKLGCKILKAEDEQTGIDYILEILSGDKSVLAWDFEFIPLPSLGSELEKAGIPVAEPNDSHVRVGVTGVNAALASTGSLVFSSGSGKPRGASLLPYVHVAVVRQSQLMVDLETWAAQHRENGFEDFRKAANVFVVSGASRTADIAMELVMGAHGPAELHIILVK